ncbi:MAG: hypothetical protein ABI811_08515 [Acidobacteriota bacterium]
MANRGPTSFQKKQKEEKRKEKQRDKLARRLQKKDETPEVEEELVVLDGPIIHDYMEMEEDRV